VSISITGADPSDFAQTNNCPLTLAPAKKCTISVTFSPKALGTRTATLSVSDNASNSPQTVSLSGTSVKQAVVSPTSLTFALQSVGTTSAAKIVTLINNLPTALLH